MTCPLLVRIITLIIWWTRESLSNVVLIIKKIDPVNEVADVLQGVEVPNVEFSKRNVKVY